MLGRATRLRAQALEIIGEKLTRVVFWSAYGLYIDRVHVVSTHVVKRGDDEVRIAELIRHGQLIEVPPGVFLGVRRASDDPANGMIVTDLWGRVRLFTSVLPRQ